MGRPDFLATDNACGQTALKLVARGNAIIAELCRLSEFIPAVFQNLDPLANKYHEVIFNFSYFKDIDQWDAKISEDEVIFLM